MALSATVRAEIGASLTSVLDQGTATFPASLSKVLSFTDGAGANQVSKLFADTRTLSASATEDLDLAGVLTDAFGATITLVRVKAILVVADAANTNNVVVGAGTNPFVGPLGGTTPTVSVAPGGVFLVARADATGWPVTGATGDILKIANSAAGTSVTYSILILGSAT